jgi:geranylgeranyl diphosphate synthase, type II
MYTQSELKKIVDKAIINLSYNTEAEKLIDPVKYVLSMGGKRIRPVLSLMALNLFRDHIEDGIMPATGLEVFHNFTLIHDDIMDQAPVRRNLPTVHNRWNLNQALLSGDVMAFIANQCFLQTPAECLVNVFSVFNKAAIEVCSGQQLDIDFENMPLIGVEEYLRMIELKTGVLLAASAKIGAIIGGAAIRDADLLYEFARNLGLAFQIQDDMLDIYGDVRVFGKIPGGDIIANKKTYLLVKAMEIAPPESLKRLQELILPGNTDSEAKVKEVIGIYDSLDIRTVAGELANEYITAAFSQLEKVNVKNERKEEITRIAVSLIDRDK